MPGTKEEDSISSQGHPQNVTAKLTSGAVKMPTSISPLHNTLFQLSRKSRPLLFQSKLWSQTQPLRLLEMFAQPALVLEREEMLRLMKFKEDSRNKNMNSKDKVKAAKNASTVADSNMTTTLMSTKIMKLNAENVPALVERISLASTQTVTARTMFMMSTRILREELLDQSKCKLATS